jgi:hypothetical protein
MSFWEIFAIFVSSSGTLASILGAFFAVYARHNGKMTREFIAAQHRETQELIATQHRNTGEFIAAQHRETQEFTAARHRETQELIAAQHREMREFLAEVLERIAKLTVDEGEKTRQEIRRLPRG